MNTRTLFQKISQKMRADFEASAQIAHSGSKGTVRENTLRAFLAEGRLPAKYGLGAGEVVGRVRDTSRQCDVVVYDKLNGVTLLYDESVQVFPIDCVYGIIEVKSALSKDEFVDALEKISAFKSMAPGGAVAHPLGGGWSTVHARPRPFGVVFAYGLRDNSLESLAKNLREWEAGKPPELWPNYVCVLEVGVIYHQGKPFEHCHDSDKITAESWPTYTPYGEDSLFQFYCVLHDMCAHMQLGPVELHHYYDPPLKIGRYIVYGRGMEGQITKDGQPGKWVRISEAAIDRVVTWCSTRPPMTYGEVLVKRFRSVPLGMDDTAAAKREVFLYNPDNLPGLHEIGPNAIVKTETGGVTFAPLLVNALELLINNELYVIATNSFQEGDFEVADPPVVYHDNHRERRKGGRRRRPNSLFSRKSRIIT